MGKVFYNNDGRREGAADMEKEFIYTRPSTDTDYMACNYHQEFDDSGLLSQVYSSPSSLIGFTINKNIFTLNWSEFLGMEINGIRFGFRISKNMLNNSYKYAFVYRHYENGYSWYLGIVFDAKDPNSIRLLAATETIKILYK